MGQTFGTYRGDCTTTTTAEARGEEGFMWIVSALAGEDEDDGAAWGRVEQATPAEVEKKRAVTTLADEGTIVGAEEGIKDAGRRLGDYGRIAIQQPQGAS